MCSAGFPHHFLALVFQLQTTKIGKLTHILNYLKSWETSPVSPLVQQELGDFPSY